MEKTTRAAQGGLWKSCVQYRSLSRGVHYTGRKALCSYNVFPTPSNICQLAKEKYLKGSNSFFTEEAVKDEFGAEGQ